MPEITKAIYLQDAGKYGTREAWKKALESAKKQNFDAAAVIFDAAQRTGRRELLASEQRKVDTYEAEMRDLDALLKGAEVDFSTVIDTSTPGVMVAGDGSGVTSRSDGMSTEYRDGAPLTQRQTMAGFVRNRGLIREGEERLSLGKYVRGLVLGDWNGADAERRAMAEGTLSAGGNLLPTVLSSQIIDLARNQTQVLNAGARLFPMSNRTVVVPKWLSDPTPAWHTESSTISPSDATVGLLTLTAKTLAGLTVISRELLEDAAEIDTDLTNAFAKQMALAVDQAALYGTGTPPMPLGIKGTSGIFTASMGANGAAMTSYDTLVDAVGTLRDNNENPNAIILSPRTARELAKLKDTQNQPMIPPQYLDGLPRLESNQVPNTLTQGTATTASDIFVGDWSQLYVGVRTQLQLTVLHERYADTGQVGLLAWWRGDIAVARPKAFSVTSGVL